MSDPRKKDDTDELTVRAAAAARAEDHAKDEIFKEVYVDENGEPAPPNETLTIERAADDLAESRNARAEAASEDADTALLAELGIKLDDEADAGKTAETAPPEDADDPTDAPAPLADDELDAELEKALSHPQIAEALRTQVAENEAARQNLRNSIDAAVTIAQASFVSQFPEFANSTPDQHARIATAIAQQNPARWAQIQSAVMSTANLFEAQRSEQQRAIQADAESFKAYAKEHDSKFDEAVKGLPRDIQAKATQEIFAMAKESGIEPAEFNRLLHTDRTLRHSAFQRMMFEAAQYRIMVRNARSATVSKALPQVARPGARPAPVSANAARIDSLRAKFHANPTTKNAAALADAERKARR